MGSAAGGGAGAGAGAGVPASRAAVNTGRALMATGGSDGVARGFSRGDVCGRP